MRPLLLAELPGLVGQEVALSDWHLVTQQQVNQFAQATGDHQWIHVDEERARAGPFGGTIAHGFLTLSLLPWFFESALAVTDSGMGVNYGLNRVRFMTPVRVGSRLRARRADGLGGHGRVRGCGQAGLRGRVAGAQIPLIGAALRQGRTAPVPRRH